MARNKRPNPYKQVNEAFLEVKAKEEGMVVLDNGVLYRVLETGSGVHVHTQVSVLVSSVSSCSLQACRIFAT